MQIIAALLALPCRPRRRATNTEHCRSKTESCSVLLPAWTPAQRPAGLPAFGTWKTGSLPNTITAKIPHFNTMRRLQDALRSSKKCHEVLLHTDKHRPIEMCCNFLIYFIDSFLTSSTHFEFPKRFYWSQRESHAIKEHLDAVLIATPKMRAFVVVDRRLRGAYCLNRQGDEFSLGIITYWHVQFLDKSNFYAEIGQHSVQCNFKIVCTRCQKFATVACRVSVLAWLRDWRWQIRTAHGRDGMCFIFDKRQDHA